MPPPGDDATPEPREPATADRGSPRAERSDGSRCRLAAAEPAKPARRAGGSAADRAATACRFDTPARPRSRPRRAAATARSDRDAVSPDVDLAQEASPLPGAHRGGFQRLPTAPVAVTVESAPAEPGGDSIRTPTRRGRRPTRRPTAASPAGRSPSRSSASSCRCSSAGASRSGWWPWSRRSSRCVVRSRAAPSRCGRSSLGDRCRCSTAPAGCSTPRAGRTSR